MGDLDESGIRAYLEQLIGKKLRPKRIRAILVNPTSQLLPKMYLEVGRSYSGLEPGAPKEKVVAIFETASFLVCTPDRGAGKGLPYFFSRQDILRVEEME